MNGEAQQQRPRVWLTARAREYLGELKGASIVPAEDAAYVEEGLRRLVLEARRARRPPTQ